MHGMNNIKTTVQLMYETSVAGAHCHGCAECISGLWKSAVLEVHITILEEDAACVFEFRVLRVGQYGQDR